MPELDIRKRLDAAIDRQGWTAERERLARGMVYVFEEAVRTMIDEAVREDRALRRGRYDG